jgi:ABC-2 type transport system permease protein
MNQKKQNATLRRPGQLKAFFAIAWYAFRAQTRNPATFFFGFVFPIVFISIFGLLGNNPQKIQVGITGDTNNPVVETLKKQVFLEFKQGTMNELETQVINGKIAGIIEVKKTEADRYKIRVIKSTGFQQEASTIITIVSGIVDKANLELAEVTDPKVSFITEEATGRKPRYIDFALPGQIGFALLSTALFGTVFGLIYLKKTGVLKRMFATPTKPLTILLAQGASRLIVTLAQTMMIVLVGVLAFKFYLPHGIITFLEIVLLSIFGLVAFLGFGYLIAGLSQDENAASPLTNLITLPQFLLSGTFFPSEALPSWLQPIATNLPLAYFNQAIRHITTEGGTLMQTWPYLLGLAAWGAVTYILAAKTFKWE